MHKTIILILLFIGFKLSIQETISLQKVKNLI